MKSEARLYSLIEKINKIGKKLTFFPEKTDNGNESNPSSELPGEASNNQSRSSTVISLANLMTPSKR